MSSHVLVLLGGYFIGTVSTWFMLRPRLCPRCKYYLSWRDILRTNNHDKPEEWEKVEDFKDH